MDSIRQAHTHAHAHTFLTDKVSQNGRIFCYLSPYIGRERKVLKTPLNHVSQGYETSIAIDGVNNLMKHLDFKPNARPATQLIHTICLLARALWK